MATVTPQQSNCICSHHAAPESCLHSSKPLEATKNWLGNLEQSLFGFGTNRNSAWSEPVQVKATPVCCSAATAQYAQKKKQLFDVECISISLLALRSVSRNWHSTSITAFIRLGHESHPGIVKTKQCIRKKYRWPCFDKQDDTTIQSYLACQAMDKSTKNLQALLQLVPLPDRPWEKCQWTLWGPLNGHQRTVSLSPG